MTALSISGRDRYLIVILGIVTTLPFGITGCTEENQISFNDQIRPIFNEHCVSCHGGVKEEGGLNLIFRESVLSELPSGKRAIVPGSPKKSELLSRLVHHDPKERMPLDEPALSHDQIDIIKEWIEQGARWEVHWAYQSPKDMKVPELESNWINNDVDAFVLERLQHLELNPNKQAPKTHLIRRASLDLLGLPPSVEQINKFVLDDTPGAYEQLLDGLLDSEHYGEKWAAMWLDLARYADSKGYEKDNHREIWKYRDWVINAFNEDKPFDEFTIEQLAGDLLENPSIEDYVATGFHRNTMNNSEGGVQNEEYRMAAVIDRVNTTWEVWNSTTFSCAQCHGHPYDPFTHENYYEFADFFNNTRDQDISDDSPNMKFYSTIQEKEIDRIKEWVRSKANSETEAASINSDLEQLIQITEPKIWSYTAENINKTATVGDDYLLEGRHGGVARFKMFPLMGTPKLLVNCRATNPDSRIVVRLDEIDGPVIAEWDFSGTEERLHVLDVKPIEGQHDIYLHFESETASEQVNDRVALLFWLIPYHALQIFELDESNELEKSFLDIVLSPVERTPIQVENPEFLKRNTSVLNRGNWLTPEHVVTSGVPDIVDQEFGPYPKNRLGLAQWLVSSRHPLTSRVIVNRLWEQLFGRGLVSTLEDFGSLGDAPSHPELLDYLAIRFEEIHRWSIKSFLKEVMMSATYRQSSITDSVKLSKDPFNKWLSRGPRFRLSAEQIRDQALASSGLLNEKLYGRSVMPYLPEEAWNVVYPQYTSVHWKLSEDEDKYRRAIYTYWKRSSPYPANMTFDMQSRDLCASRRIRTNTPLQALITLNDPVFVEAANALGNRMVQQEDMDLEEQISFGYQCAIAKKPDPTTLRHLTDLYESAKLDLSNREKMIEDIDDQYYSSIELESPMAVVANAILNLDAFVMKE